MKNKITILLMLSICIIALKCTYKNTANLQDKTKAEVKAAALSAVTSEAPSESESYSYTYTKNRFGFPTIDSMNIMDILPIDWDKDGLLDTIAILEPMDIETREKDRVLILSKTLQNGSKLYKRYDKILCNDSDLLGLEDLAIHGNGFVINGDWGHNHKTYTNVFIAYKKNNFFVDSIKIETSGDSDTNYEKTYPYHNFPLDNYKRETIGSLLSRH
jgi:hypothetical protein